MKGKLYTLLKVKSDYGLTTTEKLLWWLVEDATHEEYVRNLIELRDAGLIHEDNDGNSLVKRNRYLTEKGRANLPKLKRLYLNGLWLKNRWKILTWTASGVATILLALIDSLKN